MTLKEYIQWANQVDEYEISPQVADPHSWGYKNMGKVKLPERINIKNAVPGKEGYSSIRNDSLTNWAKNTWPFLQCMDAKIQVQSPGEKCDPHLDFLGYYLENVSQAMPGLLTIEHSLEKPGLDVWRMFIALDDHATGQTFCINGKEWQWRKGDCIRLNNWQALHWTENKSKVDRALLKITGIKK